MNSTGKSKMASKTKTAKTALRRAGGLGGAAVLMLASNSAFAIATGTDLNLSMKAASGGMAGAAYTKPQEASAAVFGNPATMTQFGGTNFNFGAGYLVPELEVTQTGAGALDGVTGNVSKSGAENYVAPDLAVTHELGNGWYLGAGIEADAGLGADYRPSPLTVPSLSANPAVTGIPLVVELVSFNVNLAAAKKVTPQTSVGAALTIGFGMAQLGTVGPAGAALAGTEAGGTSGSVHAFSVGGSLGVTHQLNPDLLLSAAVKSSVKYDFKNIVWGGSPALGGVGFQNLGVEQPLEVVLGAAYDIAPNWMVEADLVWKNWSRAATYQDIYNDQFMLAVGSQYKTGPWSLRLGYSYAQDILRDTPNSTLGGLTNLGLVPLNVELNKLVQMSLVPVVFNHTLTAGVGYDLSKNIRLDTFAALALKGDATRTTNLGVGLTGMPVGPETYKADIKVWAAGVGLSFKF
jgi:long-chain fatty acid transport protein